MDFRPARHDELDQLAAIGYKAFASSPIDHHFYPEREIDPNEYQASFLGDLIDAFNRSGTKVMVGELKATRKIVGYITMQYYGTNRRRAHFDGISPSNGEL
jgi:hypothetical protein